MLLELYMTISVMTTMFCAVIMMTAAIRDTEMRIPYSDRLRASVILVISIIGDFVTIIWIWS